MFTDEGRHATVRNRWGEFDCYTVVGNIDLGGRDDTKLLQRIWVFGIVDEANEICFPGDILG